MVKVSDSQGLEAGNSLRFLALVPRRGLGPSSGQVKGRHVGDYDQGANEVTSEIQQRGGRFDD